MSRFMYWAFVSKAAFDVDVFERPFFNKTGYYGMYAMPPGSDTGGFADQAPHRTSDRIARFLAVLGAGAGNSHWMWYAGQHDASLGSGYLGFIYRARSGSVSADAPAALPDSKVFRGTGLAFLNTNLLDGRDNTQIHFKSSPMGRQSHGYNANNAFLLNVDGERVLITSGRRDVHGSPHHKQYMWHSKSDNAILVNGEGQRKHSPSATGRITHFRTSDGVDVLAGEAAASYANLDRWTRRIVFIKPDLIVIHDLLEAPEASTYTWNLHAQHAFTLGDNTAGFEYDGNQLGVRFLEPAGLQLSQTDTFDVPPHDWANFELDEHHLSATTPDTAKRREFVTVIEPTTGTSAQVDMTKDGDKHVLRFALEGASGTVTLDDRSFAVEWQDTAWRFKDE